MSEATELLRTISSDLKRLRAAKAAIKAAIGTTSDRIEDYADLIEDIKNKLPAGDRPIIPR